MKQLIVLIILFSFFIPVVNAANEYSGITPDSKVYFLKIWYEKIILFFTFDAVKKAEKYKEFAEKRILEAKEMILQGKDELIKKPGEIFRSYLAKAQKKLENAVQGAIERKKDDLKTSLDQKIQEIKNKIKESINIW